MKGQTGWSWRQAGAVVLLICLLQPQAAMARLEIRECRLTAPQGMLFVTTLMDDHLTSTTSFVVTCTTRNGNGNGNGSANGIGNGNGHAGSARLSIGLSAGSSGDVNIRKLRSDTSELAYNFYQDRSFQQPWDNAGNLKTLDISGDVTMTITVYGKINNNAANLKKKAGNYSDAITVTIIW